MVSSIKSFLGYNVIQPNKVIKNIPIESCLNKFSLPHQCLQSVHRNPAKTIEDLITHLLPDQHEAMEAFLERLFTKVVKGKSPYWFKSILDLLLKHEMKVGPQNLHLILGTAGHVALELNHRELAEMFYNRLQELIKTNPALSAPENARKQIITSYINSAFLDEATGMLFTQEEILMSSCIAAVTFIGAVALGVTALVYLKSYLPNISLEMHDIDKSRCYQKKLFKHISKECLEKKELQYAYQACLDFDSLFPRVYSQGALKWEEEERTKKINISLEKFIEQGGGIGEIIKAVHYKEDGSPKYEYYFTDREGGMFNKQLKEMQRARDSWEKEGFYAKEYAQIDETVC